MGNESLKIGFKLRKLSLEVSRDPHEFAGIFDAFDGLLEKLDLDVHACSLNAVGTGWLQFRSCPNQEELMAYALFENDAKLSRAFPTEKDAWQCAEESGLVVAGVHGEKRLDDDYAIKPCPPDTEETTSPGIDLFGINKLT